MNKNKNSFEARDILSDGIPYGLFAIFSQQEKKRMVDKVQILLRNLIRNYLSGYLQIRSTSEKPYRFFIQNNPENSSPQRKPLEYKKLQEIGTQAMLDYKNGNNQRNKSYQTEIEDYL